LDRADEEFELTGSDSLAGKFATRIADSARLYEDGLEPDFANASLAELFAWSLAPRARHKFAGTREGGGSTANGRAVDKG
jgi:hypothetical protein